MCKQGNEIPLALKGVSRNPRDIDACIAPIVEALTEAGLITIASCCGHGKPLGNIALKDGRELILAKDFKTARKVEQLILDQEEKL
jgi:hypothetical protein